MNSLISEGIKISVETFYQNGQSNPLAHEFIFSYRITIENLNFFPVKLLSRQWYIFDSNNERREVQGEGVVGLQPVINGGNTFQYMSGCNLNSEMGRMLGYYKFENLDNQHLFEVKIPAFELVAPLKMN